MIENTDNTKPLFSETLRGGQSWSHVLKRGTTLRIVDIEGNANVSALFYNADWPIERYNMADTLKAQQIARLTAGKVLYSDMGRILISITNDTCGWHDTICGVSNAETINRLYGTGTFQERSNDFFRNGYDGFLVELGKWGLGKRDLAPNVNFFSKVASLSTDQGELRYHGENSHPGAYLDLRAEMNVLVILNTCPHPLNPSNRYAPGPVELMATSTPPPTENDPCRISHPENERGFTNTERYFL
jgi:uncharacterized protein